MNTVEFPTPTPEPKRRWFLPTPSWLVSASLAVTAILFFFERWRWFAFNEHKGWTVLLAVAGIGVILLSMLSWFLVALTFRRRFQFGIRTLLVLTVAVALPFSWLAVERKKASEQRDELVQIRNSGGDVYYDFRFDEMDRLLPNPTQPEPSWLRELLGDDFFARVYYVEFSKPSTHVTDDIVPHVARLAGLRQLLFTNSSVTDTGLIQLCRLTELEDLLFRGEAITDKGLQHLASMKKLKNLCLSDTQVGDSGMVSVARLPSLRFLDLSGTNVGDEGLANLQTSPQLEWLDLSETPVTDSRIEYVRNFKGIRYLNLAGTHITSKGLLSLRDIPSLHGIKLTDVLAGRGAQYRNLRHVSTKITAEDMKKVREALPNCTISP